MKKEISEETAQRLLTDLQEMPEIIKKESRVFVKTMQDLLKQLIKIEESHIHTKVALLINNRYSGFFIRRWFYRFVYKKRMEKYEMQLKSINEIKDNYYEKKVY